MNCIEKILVACNCRCRFSLSGVILVEYSAPNGSLNAKATGIFLAVLGGWAGLGNPPLSRQVGAALHRTRLRESGRGNAGRIAPR